MLNMPEKFIVFDMEWTAWEGSRERNWNRPGEYREIYDIGGVRVEGKDFEITDTFRRLIVLELVQELPLYNTDLTGITDEEVKKYGVPFDKAFQDFVVFAQDLDLYCWGKDGDVLAENCELKGAKNPFSLERFKNMREIFKQHGIPADDYYSSTIVEAFGQKNQYTAHQGLDDATNIVEALRLLQKATG